MKLKLMALAALLLTPSVYADQHVNGYYRGNGTYVQPHYRSDNDGNSFNNYTTRGNENPYTGQKGYRDLSSNNDSGIYSQHKSSNPWANSDD